MVLLAVEGGVATVTVNRAEVLNALNAAVFDELKRVFSALTLDDAAAAAGGGFCRAEDEGLAVEAEIFGGLCATEDMREGTTAFLAKRQAAWRGR